MIALNNIQLSWRFLNDWDFFSGQNWIFIVLDCRNPLSCCELVSSINSHWVYVEKWSSWHKVHTNCVLPMVSRCVPCWASLSQRCSQACLVNFLSLKLIITTLAAIALTNASLNWAKVLSSHFYSTKSSWWANT